MNKLLFLPLSILLSLASSCSPDQINSAIEACKGDPNCYEIIDEAIESELSARGITGGKMTNIELNEVGVFLEQFTFGEEIHNMNKYKISYLFWMIKAIDNENYEMWNEVAFTLDKFSGVDDGRLFDHKFLKLNEVGLFNKQLIYYDETPIKNFKLVIYKTGEESFNYELYLDKYYEIKIDLRLNSLFIDNERYTPIETVYQNFRKNYQLNDLYQNTIEKVYSETYSEKINAKESSNGFFVHIDMELKNSNLDAVSYIQFFPVNKNYYYTASLTTGEIGWDGESSNSNSIALVLSKNYGIQNHTEIFEGLTYKEKITLETNVEITTLADLIRTIENNIGSDKVSFTSVEVNSEIFLAEIKEIFNEFVQEPMNFYFNQNRN